jgi:hypothetical protein
MPRWGVQITGNPVKNWLTIIDCQFHSGTVLAAVIGYCKNIIHQSHWFLGKIGKADVFYRKSEDLPTYVMLLLFTS